MQLTHASLMATLALAMGSATAAPAPTLGRAAELLDRWSSLLRPAAPQQENKLPLPARTIFQFPEEDKGVWLENLVTAPNGDLFMTTMWPSAALYKLSAPSSPAPQMDLVHTFPDAQGLSGITATGDNCYVVVASQYSALTAVVPGSGAVWSIQVPADGRGEPVTRKITDLPEGEFLNGATTVPQAADCGCRCASTVLVSDSFKGQVWRVDTKTGAYGVAAKAPEMDPVEGAALPFGVNGIKVMHGHLYWANSNQLKIFRVAVDATGTRLPGAAVETVAAVEADFIDDFDVDAAGILWLTTNADNKVLAIRPDGAWEVVVGAKGDMTVAGDSAAKFGRGADDKKVLYVTTSGASAVPVNGTVTEPAKVVAIDTSSY